MVSNFAAGTRWTPQAADLFQTFEVAATGQTTAAYASGISDGQMTSGAGWQTRGSVSFVANVATLTEASALNSSLMQTLRIPTAARYLSFDLYTAGFTSGATGVSDAFEVALVNPTGGSLLGGLGLSLTDALLNIQADGRVHAAAGVTIDGQTVSTLPAAGAAPLHVRVDVSAIADLRAANLYFDLLGFGTRSSSVGVANVAFSSPVNDTPVGLGDSVSVRSGEIVAINVLANDSDSNGDALGIYSIVPPAHGRVTVAVDGTLSYQSNADYAGPDAFYYVLSDGVARSAPTRVDIQVSSVPGAPVAVADHWSVLEDTAQVLDVRLNDSDPNNDPLSVVPVDAPAHGTLSALSDGSLRYTPQANYFGADSFTYQLFDGGLYSQVASVTLDVVAVNDAPVTSVVSLLPMAEDGSARRITQAELLDMATDAEGQILTATGLHILDGAGQLTDNGDGSWSFTPMLNDDTQVRFGYAVSDGSLSVPGVADMELTTVNDAPTLAVVPDQTLNEGSTLSVQLVGNDVDSASVTYVLDTAPAGASIDANTGLITWLAADGPAQAVFSAHAVDSQGASSAVTSFTVTVANVAPVLTVVVPSEVRAGIPAVVQLSATDIGQDTLQEWRIDWGDGTQSTVAGNATQASHTYSAAQPGTSIAVQAVDEDGIWSVPAILRNVLPDWLSLTPVAVDDVVLTAEDTAVTFDVRLNDHDPNGDQLTVLLVSNPAHGTLLSLSDGSLRYTPDANYFGGDSFSYRVSDGALQSGLANVSLTITSVNDIPTLAPVADQSLPEGSTFRLTLAGSDVESPTLTYVLDTAPAGASIDAATGVITWLAADGPAQAQFAAHAVDGQGASSAGVQFVVNVSNVAPVLTVDAVQQVYVGDTLALSLSATDVGRDTISQWRIDWGDGTQSTLAGTATQATHVFSVAQTGARIQVTAVDEDGVWTAPVLVRTILSRVVTPPPGDDHESEHAQQEQEQEHEKEKEKEKERETEASRGGHGNDNELHQPAGFGDNGMPRYSTRFDDSRRNASVHMVEQSQNRPERNLAPVSTEIRVAQAAPRTEQQKPALQVRNVVLTDRGLRVRFNQAIDARKLQPDGLVVLRGDEPVRGKLVPDPDGEGFRFDAADGSMEPGEYRVVLKAESGAFVTPDGIRLDGDGDGVSGGDFRGQARVNRTTAQGTEQMENGAGQGASVAPTPEGDLLFNGGIGGALSLAIGQQSLLGRARGGRRNLFAQTWEPVRLREAAADDLDFAIQSVLPAADAGTVNNTQANNWEIRL
jgi:hypothetical protein